MFQIDLKSHKSVYAQIVDNVKELIVKGVLKEDDKLPSVRELSKQITVNPNTIQKAYKELEQEGYIYTSKGLGTFISSIDKIQVDKKKMDEIKREILSVYKSILYLGFTEDEAKKIINEAIKEECQYD